MTKYLHTHTQSVHITIFIDFNKDQP